MTPRRYLFLLISWMLASTFSAAAAAAPEEWVIKQHQTDIGDLVVYITHDAVKYSGSNAEFFCLAKAPEWKVICYRPKEKVFWSGPLRQLNCNMLFNPMYKAVPSVERMKRSKAFRDADIKIIGSGQWNGITYTEYSATNPTRIIRTAKDINVDWHAADFMNRLTGTPRLDEVPLYMRKRYDKVKGTYAGRHAATKELPFGPKNIDNDLRTGPQVILFSTSCKKIKFNPSAFDVPKGFKRVNDVFDVTYSKSLKEDLTNAANSFGFTTDDLKNNSSKKVKIREEVTKPASVGKQ